MSQIEEAPKINDALKDQLKMLLGAADTGTPETSAAKEQSRKRREDRDKGKQLAVRRVPAPLVPTANIDTRPRVVATPEDPVVPEIKEAQVVGQKIPTKPVEKEVVDHAKLIEGVTLVLRNDLDDPGELLPDAVNEKRWTDNELLIRGGIKIGIYTDTELLPMALGFWKMLAQEVSNRSVGYMMILAWNLRSPTSPGDTVFEPDQYFSSGMDVDVASLSSKIIVSGVKECPAVTELDTTELVSASCFIAASLLRLFTKRSDSWEKAYPSHLPEGYYKFYKETYPIPSFTPDPACVSAIAQTLQNLPVFSGTLGRFLYHYHSLKGDKGICTMLFEQHIGLTGMHALNLFIRVVTELHITPMQLASACWHRMTGDAIRKIMHVLTHANKEKGVPGKENERATWRYARIFGHEYFVLLQSKNCKALICVLAYLCELLGQTGNQDILNIAAISRIPEETRAMYRRWALTIHTFFTMGADASENNPMTRKWKA
ncbi:TPA_asm: nucleocapsid protein [Luffa virus 1]|uniref:Nucleoprotein n=1 Tax=Luffa virus 1 TaxID=2977973 RepID=A0A9N6YJF6_9RHAB|nr:TPA_asm: nucleocapsid protein [Luffa virus 1]